MRDIINIVNRLVLDYETRNPFKIAEYEGFTVQFKSYSLIKGYYYKAFDSKFIVINQNLDELSRHIVCAHELGHALLHDIDETCFLKEYTLFPIHSKIEREANAFAAELIINDDFEPSSYYDDGYKLDSTVFEKLIDLKNLNRRY